MNWGKLLDRLVVVAVCLLISFIHLTSQIVVLLPAYGGFWTWEAFYSLVPFNILVLAIWINYYLSCATDPGKVPKEWEPPSESNILERKKSGKCQPRFCRACRSHKPPRSHHCSSCGRCVLRMDHHCPWLNNCVGHGNHGHFIRFLAFVLLGCGFNFYLLVRHLITLYYLSIDYSAYFEPPTVTYVVFLALNLIANAFVILPVFFLFTYQVYSIASGNTTIEGWEMEKVEKMVKRGRIPPDFPFPYNLGMMANLRSILGEWPLFWWYPQPPAGNGLSYPLGIPPSEDGSPYVWPPLEYERAKRADQAPAKHLPRSRPPVPSSAAAYRERAPSHGQMDVEMGDPFLNGERYSVPHRRAWTWDSSDPETGDDEDEDEDEDDSMGEESEDGWADLPDGDDDETPLAHVSLRQTAVLRS